MKEYLVLKPDKLGIIGRIVNNSEGSFIYASLFIDELKNDKTILDNIIDYPKGLEQFYLLSLNRKFANIDKYNSIKEILGYIIISTACWLAY